MKIKVFDDQPYGELICLFLNKQFPQVAHFENSELVDIISTIMVGTKEVRYGSLPVPEHMVELRKTIREAVEAKKPIPVLVPWGSIKANFSSTLDIAELSALQRLNRLSRDIAEYYTPGLEIVLRVEDTSGYDLFQLEGDYDTIKKNIDSYSRDMKTLVSILSPKGEMRVQLESEMDRATEYHEVAQRCSDLIESYLYASKNMIQFAPDKVKELPEYQVLENEGWKGIISNEQREHYLSAYRKLYADWSEAKMVNRLSLYFGGAWARHILKMTGKQSYWDRFIQLAFIPPIKGLPEGYNYNYVYYRTLPLSEARTHIAPWRAKGYVKIDGNNAAYKLTTFNDRELANKLIPLRLEVTDSERNLSVLIKADYYLES